MNHYSSFCWNCGNEVGGAFDNQEIRCKKCGWFICDCGACCPNCELTFRHNKIIPIRIVGERLYTSGIYAEQQKVKPKKSLTRIAIGTNLIIKNVSKGIRL